MVMCDVVNSRKIKKIFNQNQLDGEWMENLVH